MPDKEIKLNGSQGPDPDNSQGSEDKDSPKELEPVRLLLGFLDRNLGKFSRPVQDIIGVGILLLLLIVVVHGFVAPYIVRASVYVKESKEATKQQAKEYQVKYGGQIYYVNQTGDVMLAVSGGFPRKVSLQIRTPQGDLVDNIHFWGPWPIYNAVYPKDFEAIIVHLYKPEGERIELLARAPENHLVVAFWKWIGRWGEAYAQPVKPTATSRYRLPLSIVVHVEGLGDISCPDGGWCGTKGKSRKLEGFRINLHPPIKNLMVRYKCHIQDSGDSGVKQEGEFCGTQGQAKRLEGFEIWLEGADKEAYDVYYQAHIGGKGDTPVGKNGNFVGTKREGRQVEAINVWIEKRQ